MYFESMSGDEEIRWLSKGLPNMLVTDLAQTPGLDVISSQRIQEILTEIGEDNLENINKSVVPEIAQRAGAGAVVVGSIFKSGSEIRLDVQVQEVGTGRVLSAESVRGEDVFPLVDELTGRIRASLDLGDRPEGRPIADVTTPSLEAFQIYSDGLEALRNYRYQDARELFERAVNVDPSFAMAYFRLWDVTRRQGEATLSHQYYEKTLENMDRLPDREKLLVQAEDLHQMQSKSEEAAQVLETLIASYPDEEDAYNDLQGIYGWLNQPDRALDAAERGVKAVRRSGLLRNTYGYLLLRRARYAEGIRELETYAELSPNEANPHDSLAEAYLFTGQPEKSLERYARALEVDPTFGASHLGRAYAYAMSGRYDEALGEMTEATSSPNLGVPPSSALVMEAFFLGRVGRYREGGKKLSEAASIAESQGDLVGQVQVEHFQALLDLERGNDDDVIARVRRMQKWIPDVTPAGLRDLFAMTAHLLAGIAEARRGNLDAAREHVDPLTDLNDPDINWQNWMPDTLRGEIALATGDLPTAESAFAAAEPELKMFFNMGSNTGNFFLNNLTMHDGPARVKVAQGDLAGAVKSYRRLNTPDISAKYTAMLEPRFVLETARLLDKMGDKEGARAEYGRFLELWKDADAGLPELKEARAYVAAN
jgi:tetratricopeptide (TPR) repeat protein